MTCTQFSNTEFGRGDKSSGQYLTRKKSSVEARPTEIKRLSHVRQRLSTDRRGACKEQLSPLKASGSRAQREGRAHSTAVNLPLERYFPCGVIFPVPIFRKEFACLLSPPSAPSEIQSLRALVSSFAEIIWACELSTVLVWPLCPQSLMIFL